MLFTQALPLEKNPALETDAPYSASQFQKRVENRTGYTRYVVEMLTSRNQSVEEVAKATYENARSLFRIDSEN